MDVDLEELLEATFGLFGHVVEVDPKQVFAGRPFQHIDVFGEFQAIVFGLKLGLFPIAGGEVSLDRLILPAFTLAILLSSKYTRQVRTAVLEELGQDYVTGLKARGMSMQRILWRHVLPNAFLPLITLLGLAIGWLLGGVAVIEIVFSWPGIGRVAVRAIEMRDYPLLQGFVLWIATLYMIVNLIVDISYTYLDPRLRKGAKA